MFPSFGPGSTDRPDRGGAAALGAGSCSLHLFLQEEVSNEKNPSLILNQFDVCCSEVAANSKSAVFRFVFQVEFQISRQKMETNSQLVATLKTRSWNRHQKSII